ncbi:putative ATP synthase, F1 beta subunit [Medicago truncatula]|uniref:ATP synthase F1 beta subunit n=1 Tax=Medicago truncatula TaxID=3880 RepID=A0A072U3N1_MEDTR|nr:ATP synthase F1 beta subunit [Medicago truncatula]RHN51759.1 putative ATP synthase, F1 beta subunit [Medicago truncatula]
MASRRLVSLIRSFLRRSSSKPSITASTTRLTSQSRVSPYGYLLNRVADYAIVAAAAPAPFAFPAKEEVSRDDQSKYVLCFAGALTSTWRSSFVGLIQ